MTLGHLVFAFHFVAMVLRFGPRRLGAAAFNDLGWVGRLLNRAQKAEVAA
jgi:cytochrome c oxidase cbb3-type subunit 1